MSMREVTKFRHSGFPCRLALTLTRKDASRLMSKPVILVVDDSKLMRRAISKLLGEDYSIIEAVDGEDGLQKLYQHEEIKLVFSDLSMPNLDGFGLLEQVRNHAEERIANMPVIVITGAEDDEKTREIALERGASDFISKPFDSAQIKTRAKTHIRLDTTTRNLDEAKRVIEETSTIDELTGLTNKRYFLTRSDDCLAFCRRHHAELAIARLDIDSFNKIYTSYGKNPANHIIISIGNILKECMRREDTAARIGVAKFALVLPSTNRAGATTLCERIQEKIRTFPYEFGGISISVSVSIGVSVIDISPETTIAEFADQAEKCLVQAIHNGANSLVIDGKLIEATPAEKPQTEITEAHPPVIEATVSYPDMETAIDLLEQNQQEKVTPYLGYLLRRILPLLELCNEKLKLDIDDAIEKIRQKIH